MVGVQAVIKNIECLKLLLNIPNIDVNIVDNNGNGAVHQSMKDKNIGALELLLNVHNIDMSVVEEVARDEPEIHKAVEERREERRREQQRQVSKVLVDGLYDPDSPISKLLGVRMEVMGEIIWQEMMVSNWQFFSDPENPAWL